MSGSARVLLLEPDRAHGRVIARVIKAAAFDVQCAPALSDVPADTAWDMVIANIDGSTVTEQRALFDRFADHQARGRLLVVTSARDRAELGELLQGAGMANILAKDGEVDPEELLTTTQKVLRGDVFGLDKYFQWGTRTETIRLTSSEERAMALEACHRFGTDAGAQKRLVELYCTAAEELVSNALYNAPINADGERPFAHLDRSVPVTLGPGQVVELSLASDGRRLGLSVSDPFGSLKINTVTDYLGKCFRKGQDQVDQKPGGAGLGLYYVFEALSHFVINLAPGQRTEFIGLIDVRGRFKDFVQRGKSFNVFVSG